MCSIPRWSFTLVISLVHLQYSPPIRLPLTTGRLPDKDTKITTECHRCYHLIQFVLLEDICTWNKESVACVSVWRENKLGWWSLDAARSDTTTGNLFAGSGKEVTSWWYTSLQCIAVLSGNTVFLLCTKAYIDQPLKSNIVLPVKNNIFEPVLTIMYSVTTMKDWLVGGTWIELG